MNRIVLLAAFVALSLQIPFIRRFDEPYPAVVMPGFEGNGTGRDGRIAVPVFDAVFIAGGDEYSFPASVLFDEFPDSHRMTFARKLKPSTAPLHPSSREWLSRRAGVLVPGREVERVEIRWYNWDGATRTPTGTLTVDLRP